MSSHTTMQTEFVETRFCDLKIGDMFIYGWQGASVSCVPQIKVAEAKLKHEIDAKVMKVEFRRVRKEAKKE